MDEENKAKKQFGIDFWITMISITHFCIYMLSWVVFAVMLIHWLIKYGSLPAEIGIHFAQDGTFDVEAEKFYGFYPFIITLLALVIITAAQKITNSRKVKPGLRLKESGEVLFRGIFMLSLDIEAAIISIFFSNYWSMAVVYQHPLNMEDVKSIVFASIIAVPAITVILLIVTAIVFRDKKK